MQWYYRATDWFEDFEKLDTQRRREYRTDADVRSSLTEQMLDEIYGGLFPTEQEWQDIQPMEYLTSTYPGDYPQPPYKYGDAIRGAVRGGHGGRLDYQKFAMIGLELDKVLTWNELEKLKGGIYLGYSPQEFEDHLRRFKDKWDARNRAMQDTYFHHTHLENSGLGSAIGTDEPWTAVQFANAISHYTAFGKLLPFKEVMESTEHTFASMSDIFDDRDRKMRDLFDVLPSTAADPK